MSKNKDKSTGKKDEANLILNLVLEHNQDIKKY